MEISTRDPYLAEDEKKELVAVARRAVAGWLREGRMPVESPASGTLRNPGAAFVTLTDKGRLRGCIGYTEAVSPLYRTVQECAVAAATEDPRFSPVTLDEAENLRIEISVLTPLSRIRPEDVEVGVHGLMVRKGGRRGLLLPQVAVEYGWDRETFLSKTCVKAGLSPGEWRRGAEIYAFTALVFGEEPPMPVSPAT
jgi:AmmeMemoRadiSam system protein A